MSTRKRPLAELPQPSQAHTPTRYAPSTPHAIRALQERSGAKTRSIRKRQLFTETVRPDSARGILKRLAKITAPNTRRITRTPVAAEGKENELEENEDERTERSLKRPRMTFDVEESIEEDDEPPEYEEEDSELPTAPTPSILPPDDDNPTLTFKSIDFARNTQPMSEKIDRRKSRISFAGLDRSLIDEEDDPTILSEMGRRAISEEPTGRLSRYSFGSIRMSDFGTELEVRRDSTGRTQTKMLVPEEEYSVLGVEDTEPVLEGETEHLRLLRKSPSLQGDDTSVHIPGMDESFHLEMPEDEEHEDATSRQTSAADKIPVNDVDSDDSIDSDSSHADTPEKTRQLTELEASTQQTSTKTRKRKMKMTKNGTMVPSLASGLVKRIASEAQVRRGSRKPVLGKEHVKALEQATEWFFEQVGEDLAAYAVHGRRKKTIDTSDVLMLMQRQRMLTGERDLRQMAKDWIPPDVLAELDLP